MKPRFLFPIAACLLFLCCASALAETTFALIMKDADNPYMQYMGDGFSNACAEIGVQCIIAGPADAQGQTELVEKMIALRVNAIAIAVNDSSEVSDALQDALNAGIPVISVDSNAAPEDRFLHIQQASPEIIGRVLIQAVFEMLSGSGNIAILSTTKTTPNQALWLQWMHAELDQHPEKYANLRIVDTVYGRDDYEISARLTRALLERNPELKIIIAPTVVGIKAAADVIAEAESDVKVTGLGLPSDMAAHIRSGVCPWMYLWNPIDMGYIAAYATNALATGETDGAAGNTIEAGSFGQKLITQSADGGTEIVVGNPYQFDATNIAIWEELF